MFLAKDYIWQNNYINENVVDTNIVGNDKKPVNQTNDSNISSDTLKKSIDFIKPVVAPDTLEKHDSTSQIKTETGSYTDSGIIEKTVVVPPPAPVVKPKPATQPQILTGKEAISSKTDKEISDTIMFSDDSAMVQGIKKPLNEHQVPFNNFLGNLKLKPFNIREQNIYTERNVYTEKNILAIEKPGKGSDVQYIASPDWFIVVFLFSIIMLVVVKSYFSRYMNSLFRSIRSMQQSVKIYIEANSSYLAAPYLLNFNYFLITALFCYQLLDYFGKEIFTVHGFWLYLLLAAIFVGLYIAEYANHVFNGHILKLMPDCMEHFHHIYVINKICGVALLPIALLVAYLPTSYKGIAIFIGIGMLTFFYLLRMHRGIKIINQKGFFNFYLFLYFWSFEIVPVLVLIKFLKN